MTVSRTFAQRLKQACDDHTLVPAYGLGRQVYIADRLKVSQEAVRKWFTEESVPRRDKIKALAELLGVDEAWLALGIEPEVDRSEKRANALRTDGAIYLMYGWFTVAGGHCAFPREKDARRAYVDFYAIVNGEQLAIHVSSAREVSKDVFEFILPREHEDVRCVGFVYRGGRAFHAINLNDVKDHLEKKGSGYALTVKRDTNNYKVGHKHLPMVDDIKELA